MHSHYKKAKIIGAFTMPISLYTPLKNQECEWKQ